MQSGILSSGGRVDRSDRHEVGGEVLSNAGCGDRLELILFGDQAYLRAPLTFDRKNSKTLLDEAASD